MAECVLEGYLSKKGGVMWKRRYFKVDAQHTIAYYNKPTDSKHRGRMGMNEASTVEPLSSNPKENAFQVITSNKALVVAAASGDERDQWIDCIGKAISALVQEQEHRDSTRKMRVFETAGVHFELDMKYEAIKTIGQGAYGVVISAKDTQTGKKVAVKKVAACFADLVDAKRVAREVRLLRRFDHPNVIGLLDLGAPPSLARFEDVYLVTPLMDTDLHRVIYSRQALTPDHVQFFLYQLLCGIQYFHSAGIVHRDLKPANILLNADCQLKVCDFGLARAITDRTPQPPLPATGGADGGGGGLPTEEEEVEPEEDLTEYVVTRWYRAPEVMLSVNGYGRGVDVWAAGCVLAEMLRRKPAFPGKDYIDQLKLITALLGTPKEADLAFVRNPRAKRFMLGLPARAPRDLAEVFPDAPAGARDLLRRMLEIDPGKRITVAAALAHPYLADVRDPEDERRYGARGEPPPAADELEGLELTKENLQRYVFEDVCAFHPELREDLERAGRARLSPRSGGGGGNSPRSPRSPRRSRPDCRVRPAVAAAAAPAAPPNNPGSASCGGGRSSVAPAPGRPAAAPAAVAAGEEEDGKLPAIKGAGGVVGAGARGGVAAGGGKADSRPASRRVSTAEEARPREAT